MTMTREEYGNEVQVVEYMSNAHRYGNSKRPFLFIEMDEETGKMCHWNKDWNGTIYEADYDSYEEFVEAVIDMGYRYLEDEDEGEEGEYLIEIHTDETGEEFAISFEGDEVFRATTVAGLRYRERVDQFYVDDFPEDWDAMLVGWIEKRSE